MIQAAATESARIVAGILKGRSPRMSEIAREMTGNEAANYKCVQRFLEAHDPQEVLLRLFREEAPFVIGDPTEMPRPQAKKTEYVGTLSDGETKGYWLMLLATPYHGRAIPCGFVRLFFEDDQPGCHFPQSASLCRLRDRSRSCWETGLWCWIGSSATWNCSKTWLAEGVNFVIRLKVGAKFLRWRRQAGDAQHLSKEKPASSTRSSTKARSL